MALIKCKECAAEMSENAELCPRCGIKGAGRSRGPVGSGADKFRQSKVWRTIGQSEGIHVMTEFEFAANRRAALDSGCSRYPRQAARSMQQCNTNPPHSSAP
jgi:hypothetical protein